MGQNSGDGYRSVIVSAIKFGESLSKFMIPIALLEKFGSKTFITGIEISHTLDTLANRIS